MAKVRIKVTYLDGREIAVKVTPRAQIMAEEKFAGLSDEVFLRGSYFLAWASLHKSGQEPDDFETWIDKIESAEDVTDEEPPDPTVGDTPPPADSLPSPSPPSSLSTL